MFITPKIILVIHPLAGGQDFLRGVFKYAHLYGPWFFYSEPEEEQLRQLPLPKNWDATGIITDTKDADKVSFMLKTGLPAVIFQGYRKGAINVKGDCPEASRMAVEHLLERGLKNFAFCGFEDCPWANTREKSFQTAIRQAGFEPQIYKRPRTEVKNNWGEEQMAMVKWLKSLIKPAGIMACNDDYGRNVLQACRIAGICVPEEIAVVGVDNDEWFCSISDPPLSSVKRNTQNAGYKAAELLDRLMRGEKVEDMNISVKPLYVETRQSSDILAIDDQDVAKAVRFIRENVRELIQVEDVVESVGLSRRALYDKFMRVLGRSIYAEIRRIRVELISKMLVETNLTISQIACRLGYGSAKHIARPFKKEKGMTPVEYRAKYAI